MRQVLAQLANFGLAGVTSAVGHYGLLIYLVEVHRADPVLAAVAAATLGAVINYAMNYWITFSSTRGHAEALNRFVVVAVGNLAGNTALMYLGIKVLGLHYLATQIAATGIVLTASFVAHRHWTFHVQPSK